jgi:chorismate synthase
VSANTFGTLFRVTTFGESHGAAIGAVIDGCPAGVPLTQADIAAELARRRPGGGYSKDGTPGRSITTPRNEPDEPEILSGVFEDKTLGTPIAVIIRNTSAQSKDYDQLKDAYRPGHADWPWDAKYGFRDYRGGGRSSGRETAGRVIGGAAAKAFLRPRGITIHTWIEDESRDESLTEKALARKDEGDSLGGVIGCRVEGLPPGLGEPVFGKLDAELAKALFSIGAVKGVEFGKGFAAANMRGSQHNDPIQPAGHPAWEKDLPPGVPAAAFSRNNAGGVLGGLSTGSPLELRAAFKPVPSIRQEQHTIDRAGHPVLLSVEGRHDTCVCPRALVVVEAMTALVIADLVLLNLGARISPSTI